MRCRRHELVANWVTADGVLLIGIYDLESAVMFRCGIESCGAVDNGFPDLVEVAIGICGFVPGR